MTPLYVFGLVLAVIWGTSYALFLQTYPGRFLAARLTWLTVVIGIGVDLVIVCVSVGFGVALLVLGIVGLSAIPIIARSLVNEMRDLRVLHGHQDKTGQ